jgi:hypothetical protein
MAVGIIAQRVNVTLKFDAATKLNPGLTSG